MGYRSRVDPGSLRQRVRAYCLELVDAGVYPSHQLLKARFPADKVDSILSIRTSVLIDLKTPAHDGRPLKGKTDGERTEIAARIAEVRAEKAGRGEEPWWLHDRWEVPRVSEPRSDPIPIDRT